MLLWIFLGSLKTRNRQKIRQEEFLFITGYSGDIPKKIVNRNDFFDPPKLPFQGCSKQNNPCLPSVPDYI